MKKKGWIIGGLIFLLLSVGLYNAYQKFCTPYGAWEINWKFKSPSPSEMNDVINTIGGFPAEGETYTICKYSDYKLKKILKTNNWAKMDDKSYDMIKKKVNHFQNTVSSIHIGQEEKFKKIFLNNPVTFTKDSLYFLKSNSDGSYFLSILNPNENKVYILEWVQ
ncbi:hypothetical protein [Aneurinibacillus soli]|uniref:hypothetical protein n=1 Tax=Aneurinibacillus soli TaxID=1500254 RepID=UPI000BBB00D5|nr:hypothetical protein [Aneurinibacillus soli]